MQAVLLWREDSIMATTRIMPLHIGKGRTESQAISDIIDYVSNPQKTDNGRLVTGFLILFTIQHKGISHYTFRITIIGIDKPFTDRRFLEMSHLQPFSIRYSLIDLQNYGNARQLFP